MTGSVLIVLLHFNLNLEKLYLSTLVPFEIKSLSRNIHFSITDLVDLVISYLLGFDDDLCFVLISLLWNFRNLIMEIYFRAWRFLCLGINVRSLALIDFQFKALGHSTCIHILYALWNKMVSSWNIIWFAILNKWVCHIVKPFFKTIGFDMCIDMPC